jgi:hypothetical protein
MLFFSNQMGKTHSKPLASRHDRGTAWARHAMCESAFIGLRTSDTITDPHERHAGFWKVTVCITITFSDFIKVFYLPTDAQ